MQTTFFTSMEMVLVAGVAGWFDRQDKLNDEYNQFGISLTCL